MAMTADEIAYVHAMTGDTDSNDYYLTNTELNYLYDNKTASASDRVDSTIVWALRQMCAKAFRKVSRSNSQSGDSVQANQEWEHLKALLEEWQALTGEYPSVGTGAFGLGLDTDEDLL